MPEGESYVPTARPGARAPHCWLPDGRSVLDLFDPTAFTLLRFGAADTTSLQAAARERGVPLQVHCVEVPEAAALYERALVLVRPDGHVAWRGDACDAPASLALIDQVRGAGPRIAVRHSAPARTPEPGRS